MYAITISCSVQSREIINISKRAPEGCDHEELIGKQSQISQNINTFTW